MNSVDWRPQNAFEQAVVERSGIVIAHEQIEAELMTALAGQGVPANSQIELANRSAQIVVPVGVAQQLGVRDLYYDNRYKRFTATIEVPANSPKCESPADQRSRVSDD